LISVISSSRTYYHWQLLLSTRAKYHQQTEGYFMKQPARRYKKEFSRTTGIRLSETLRDDAEQAATFQGMTFSQFLRQSLRRNIDLSRSIEKEVATRQFRAASES
jgi:hypothetical protein